MSTTTRRRSLATALAALTIALGLAGAAEAGKGGSFAAIRSAAERGSIDATISELERAEDLPCATACMGFVIDLTHHADARVRQAAAWWIARRPAQRAEVAEAATAALVAGDAIATRDAAEILGTFGHPSAVPALATAYGRAGVATEARAAIVAALGRIGHRSANPTLGAAMGDADPAVRHAAITGWRRVLRQDGAAPVAALVADPTVEVRREAASVVGMFRQAEARAALEGVLAGDADAIARRNAAWALGRLGDRASEAALRTAQTDASPLVRMTARVALRQLR